MFEADRDINHLNPVFRPKVLRLMQLLRKAKVDAFVVEGVRSLPRQCWLYGKGRFLKKDWERAYLGYDDPNISSEPFAKQVTWTLASKHLKGCAIDICPLKDGKAWWGAPKEVWDSIYDIAEKCGIQSLWRKEGIDRPHLQMPEL